MEEQQPPKPPPVPLNYRAPGKPSPSGAWAVLRICLMVVGIIILTAALAFGICTLAVLHHG
jgi:hypothetical protein